MHALNLLHTNVGICSYLNTSWWLRKDKSILMFTSTNKIKLWCQIWFSDSQAEDIPKFTECTEFTYVPLSYSGARVSLSYSGARVSSSLVFSVVFVDHGLSIYPFSFGHCTLCPSLMRVFLITLWYSNFPYIEYSKRYKKSHNSYFSCFIICDCSGFLTFSLSSYHNKHNYVKIDIQKYDTRRIK
jgi:hypothetical protein